MDKSQEEEEQTTREREWYRTSERQRERALKNARGIARENESKKERKARKTDRKVLQHHQNDGGMNAEKAIKSIKKC